MYGPHQYPEKVVPKFIRRVLRGEPCCIHGDGSHSRHFIYVEDVDAAFITILHKGVDGETYNIGCEEEMTNLEMAEKLVQAVKPGCVTKDNIMFVEDRCAATHTKASRRSARRDPDAAQTPPP